MYETLFALQCSKQQKYDKAPKNAKKNMMKKL